MKMITHIRHRGSAGRQRHDDQRGNLAPAPQRDARAARRIGASLHPWNSALVGRDQCERRRKRHLEARMHDRLGQENEHAKRGERQIAQGQRGAVHHHTDQQDRRHDEGALRRDLGARKQQIEQGREQRGERRPFLDRVAHRQHGDQRQQRAHGEEYHARDHRHVIARDRQHVAEA